MKQFFSLVFLFFSTFSIAQQSEYVDFKMGNVLVHLNSEEKKVTGKVIYTFNILKETDSIFIDAKNMKFSEFVLNKLGTHVDIEFVDIKFKNSTKELVIYNEFKRGETYELKFEYSVHPKKALYFVGWKNEAPDQIWTQGQGKYTSNWLPSIDDTNDKIEFDLSITFENDYEVIANGKLINKEVGEKTTKWSYDMNHPMSSYLVALAIGKYHKKVEHSESGIPLEMYYYPEDSLKVEPTYRYTKQMFDFLEEKIGVAYPWQNYKQVPVHDFLYAGMENTSCTIFSDAFMIDETSFVDKNFVNVNAHELAHQWFGDLVTAKSVEHHWLQEGFATYYALLAERDIFGDDYYYWRLYEYAQELLEQEKAGNSTSLLNPKSSSTTFYKKGAWVLHMLREKVGDKAFKKAIKSYLEKHQYKNVETDDFISEVEKASGIDLNEFKNKWLISKELPFEEMENNLCTLSNSIKSFLQFDCQKTPEACKTILLFDKNVFLKQQIIKKLGNHISKSTFSQNSIKPRQAIAQSLKRIPLELKGDYESLLKDKSYVTIELALFNLVNNFPADAKQYLEETKAIVGFNDKNVRLLWLVLAITSDEYSAAEGEEFINELLDYTSPKYNFEVRTGAFRYLRYISSCAEKCQENLQQATTHHNWRLSKFAKEQLKLINKTN